MKLSDCVAIVTTSIKGMGLERVKILAKNKAIAYLVVRNKSLLEKLLKNIKKKFKI